MMRWMTLALFAGCAQPKDRGQDGDGPESPACDETADAGLEIGMCAPDFALPDSEGNTVRLSDFRDKVALVDLSALW